MYPFAVAINPQAFFTANANSRGLNIWRAVRSLDHLWLKPARWAKGVSSGHIGVDGKPPAKLKPEAAIRLGDSYTAYPKHLNVVTEIWSTLTHPTATATAEEKPSKEKNTKVSGNSKSELLPRQQTRLKCIAPSRSLDVDLTLQPPLASLKEEPLEAVILANKEASAHLKTYEAPSLFNWFGATTTTTTSTAATAIPTGTAVEPATGHVVGTASVVHSSSAAPTDAASWAAEKKKLLERIHELEEKNRTLHAK